MDQQLGLRVTLHKLATKFTLFQMKASRQVRSEQPFMTYWITQTQTKTLLQEFLLALVD
jgi:hypothetical protein